MIDDIIQIALVAGPTLGAGVGIKVLSSLDKKNKKNAYVDPDEVIIDGRTRREWYELIKGLGKKDFELLTAAPIDVARDDEGNWSMDENPEYAWNTEKLMGSHYYNSLMREWYPERFCKYCSKQNCKETCGAARREKEYARDIERSRLMSSQMALKKSEWVQYNKPKPKAIMPRDVFNFMTVRDTKNGMVLYRVKFNDRTWEFTKTDIRDFQSRMRLRPTGIVDQETQRVMTRVIKNGLPIKNDRHEAGFTWNIKAAPQPGVIIITASNATHTVTEQMLEESARDLMKFSGVVSKIKTKLADAKAKDEAKAKEKLIPEVKYLESMNRQLEDDLRKWRKEMEHMTRRERNYQYKMNGYDKYNDPWDLEW